MIIDFTLFNKLNFWMENQTGFLNEKLTLDSSHYYFHPIFFKIKCTRNGISVWFIQRVELNLKFNSWLQITWTIDNEPRQMKQIIVSSIMARFCSKTTTFLLLVIKMSPSIFGIVSFSSKIFRLLFLCAYIRGTYASLRIYKMRLFNFRHLYADLKCFFFGFIIQRSNYSTCFTLP